MNFVKRCLAGGKMKGGVKVSGGVGASLLPALDLMPTSLSCSPRMLIERLTWELSQVVQNPGAIAIKSLNMILPNQLADPLDMKLLEV